MLIFDPKNINKEEFREANDSIGICIDTIEEPFVILCPECKNIMATIDEKLISWDGPIESIAIINYHQNYDNLKNTILCHSCDRKYNLEIETCTE